jgi:hypothetical protein
MADKGQKVAIILTLMARVAGYAEICAPERSYRAGSTNTDNSKVKQAGIFTQKRERWHAEI